ncbi:CCC motif membrane protein [Aquimarina spongiae]|uniref:M penetrans paralogue family 26 n=1 Tax=Aquimarina spongiae TaxID=570521 RepID=A0A1M6BMX3_9FLAO|nr:CCC motif membrane protein [Aquimarina spongiae]SHI50044.1 M penetrans paralogue family 26 [Aquimarina spongiae]
MEKQTLPNSTLILVFGILSIVGCCCYGFGIIFAIIAIIMAKKATALYNENPELYTGYQNVKTGKILAIIGLIVSALYLAYVIFMFATVGYDGILEMQEEIMKNYGG